MNYVTKMQQLPLRYNEGSVKVPSIPSSGIVQIRIFASSHAEETNSITMSKSQH